MTSILIFHSNHGPISYRFEIDADFSRKIAKFSHPLVFCTPVEGVPLGIGIGARGQKVESWGYWADKKVWRYLKPSGYITPMWRTDGQTLEDSKDCAYA